MPSGASAAIVAAASLVVGLAAAAPALAADGPRLTLHVADDLGGRNLAAGVPVTFTYTVSNDTGAALTVGPSAEVAIVAENEYSGRLIDSSRCDWAFYGLDDDTDFYTSYMWEYSLPQVVPPGPVASCALTVTPNERDIAYGGLWTMLTFQPLSNGHWDYSSYDLLDSPGRSGAAIQGTPAVGSVLSAVRGILPYRIPDETERISYQWLRDGTEIAGATSTAYTPAIGDVGTSLTVRVDDHLTGVSRLSDPVVVTRFTDVQPSYAFSSYISWLAGKGISTGYAQPDGSYQFKPTTPVSREAMAAFLYRDIAPGGYTPPGTARFSDVPTTYPFYTNVAWLAQQGISTGFADGTFKPTDAVTREAMAAFLYRAAGSPAYTPPASPRFSDVPTDYPFYKQISWLAAQGISTGYADGTFKPTAPVTREAMAAFLKRADTIFHPAG